jgi:hypothetical protein
MMVVSGRIERSEVDLRPDAVPVLGWYADITDEGGGKEGIGVFAPVEVSGEFPNGFTLRVFEPPPPKAMPAGMFKDDAGIAVARILALRDGASWSPPGAIYEPERPDWFLGGVGDFLVWYTEEELPPTPFLLTEDGTPAGLPRGYSLVRLEEWTEEEEASRTECFESAKRDALARVNDEHGTAYTSVDDMPDDLQHEYYVQHWPALEQKCGDKVKMTVVPSGADHPVSLSLDLDSDDTWIDWF